MARNKKAVDAGSVHSVSAIDEGLIGCAVCQKVMQMPKGHIQASCGLCGSKVSFRKPKSMSQTFALVITGFILLIPANVYPVMTVLYLGSESTDTILSGVLSLVDYGMYGIAFIVFIASVAVPVLKLLGILFMLAIVQFRITLNKKQSAQAYRVIELIGKWSMLDLFVVSILVTLVNLDAIATISAGIGATAFSAVVVITMLAAHSFDPRLIWDLEERSDHALDKISE